MCKLIIRIHLLAFCIIPLPGIAQQSSAEKDTVSYLNEVVITEELYAGTSLNKLYSVGSHVLQYNRAALMSMQYLSLSDYLQMNTPVFFRERGKGMMATISMRGTSASQTAVQWNGLDISMPTMGQVDFNLLPLFFFDVVEVYRGGESTLYGNGSVGGAVQLLTRPQYGKKMSFDFRQSVGSYGYYFSGLGFRVSGTNWESRTQLLYSGARNNFVFKNFTEYGQPDERLNNAAYRQYGVLQEMYFRPAPAHELSLRAWLVDYDREIQPHISCNDRPAYYENITDRLLRVMAGYAGTVKKIKMHLNTGYSHDYELFNPNEVSGDFPVKIAMHKIFGKAEMEYVQGPLSLKAGTQAEYIHPEVYSYASGIQEWRADFYLLARWFFFRKWTWSGGVRKNVVTRVNVPPSFSFGLAYQVLQNNNREVKLRTALACNNVKIPTLNDRYWGGDNTYLKPEIGDNIELGADYNLTGAFWSVQSYATAYYNRIKDWIRWQRKGSGSIMRPENILLVDAYGAEVGAIVSWTLGKVNVSLSANYAYTAVILLEQEERSNSISIGKQVPHQPCHVVNGNLKAAYKQWSFQAGICYTGARHTSDYYEILDDYLLTDVNINYTFSIKKCNFTFLAQVNNLFNVDYQNIKYFVMPGRTFNGTLNIKL